MSILFKISKFELINDAIVHAITHLKEKLEDKDKLEDEIHRKILMYKRKAEEWKVTSRRYSYIIFAMYFAIYCSFTSVFFNQLFVLDEIFKLVTQIVSLTGTTIFLICLAAAQYVRDIHYQKLLLLHSQVMHLCSIHKVEPPFMFTSDDDNDYKKMVDLLEYENR